MLNYHVNQLDSVRDRSDDLNLLARHSVLLASREKSAIYSDWGVI